ncbi:MAG: DUF423 domain-containing protein, partial [Motiliproteus sp.]|nr:DUF423 domain-containing protein [Motiliproteus sp.]
MRSDSPHWVMFLGAVSAALAVALGAFAAHGLQHSLSEDKLQTFDTASRYLMYHGLGILVLGLALVQWPQWSILRRSAQLLAVGIGVFSGSLYILCLTDLTWIAWLTPLGGSLLIVGWCCLAYGAL